MALLALSLAATPTALGGSDGPCDEEEEPITCDPWVRCILDGGTIMTNPFLSCCPKGATCTPDPLRLG